MVATGTFVPIVTEGMPPGVRVRVWDVPTRLAHWAAVGLFLICWWTERHDHMEWHLLAGFCLLGTILFRIGWGFAGGETARFANFVRAPAAVFDYLRRHAGKRHDAASPLGHNPLGGWSIVAMLGLLLAQAVLGLFAVDVDGFASGPLSRWVSFHSGRTAAHWHGTAFHVLLALIALHLVAIAYYRLVRHESLLPAMIHGYKRRATPTAPVRFAPWWRAVALATVVIAVVWALKMV